MRTMMIVSLSLMVGLFPAAWSGCGASSGSGRDGHCDGSGHADGGVEPHPDGGPTGGELTITTKAVPTCGSYEPDHQPKLNYQTPSRLLLGVQSVELMRSHKDPDPSSVALPSAVVEVDAFSGGIIATASTAQIPEGTYSHIRVGLAYGVYDVEAVAHTFIDLDGTLTIDMALSDHLDSNGLPRSQGQYTATFSALGQSSSFSGSTPLNCALSAWGGIAATSGPRFLVRVPIPNGPVVVDHGSNEAVTIDLVFPMKDTFAWRDLDEEGFADGVLDISQPPGPAELPDTLLECNLLMADRCQGEAVAPIHPSWPMTDSNISFCTDGQQVIPSCPAPGEPAFGQDASYDVNMPSFEVLGEVVLDEVTGLYWQRAVPAASFDWWEARDYCEELELAGESDWRLPGRVELVSLLDFGGLDPVIDENAFPDTPSDFFWSSSPVPFLNLAYGVRFELGFIYDHDPYGTGRVRCVRGAYTPPALRYDYDAESVLDNATLLTWQRQHSVSPMTWIDALEACEQLDLAGRDDWRLPTLKELQSLVDERRLQPSIDVVAFPGTPSEWFWSSTPIRFPADEAWATSYTDGYASIHSVQEMHLFRCVADNKPELRSKMGYGSSRP